MLRMGRFKYLFTLQGLRSLRVIRCLDFTMEWDSTALSTHQHASEGMERDQLDEGCEIGPSRCTPFLIALFIELHPGALT